MGDAGYTTSLYIESWVLGGLVITFTTARIWCRTMVNKQLGWDDFFMILGASAAIACSSVVTAAVSAGLGRHQDQITDPEKLTSAIKYTIIAPVLSIVSSGSTKISILVFLVRLMGMTAKRWHYVFLGALCAIMVALNVTAIGVIVGFCRPAAKQWDPSLPGSCINPRSQLVTGYIQSGYNVLMDVIVAIFPVSFIRKLNLNKRTKIGLCCLMGGGIFAAVATSIKVYLLKDLDKHGDITWYWAPITQWYT
ncbi:hypothetical protein F5Y17DRAFT_172175 [Xylariaceae sp. FL0594]|nr:hypothetical protein F5Y17DRAFT_172175 [Xylariaceae sp. FL0594]